MIRLFLVYLRQGYRPRVAYRLARNLRNRLEGLK